MKRVMIIGGSGSGKSTTARMLGDITGLPVIHMDPMYYKAGWVQRAADETRAMILEATAKELWILEGNNTATFPQRVARADVFVFLDLPTYLLVWRAYTRTIKWHGKVRLGSSEGCPERFDRDFLVNWVPKYKTRGWPSAMSAMEGLPKHIECYHLKSRKDVRQFLAKVAARHEQT